MTYPIVSIKTEDGLVLHGLLTEPNETSKSKVLHF